MNKKPMNRKPVPLNTPVEFEAVIKAVDQGNNYFILETPAGHKIGITKMSFYALTSGLKNIPLFGVRFRIKAGRLLLPRVYGLDAWLSEWYTDLDQTKATSITITLVNNNG